MQRSFICGLLLSSLPILVEGQEKRLTAGEVPVAVTAATKKRTVSAVLRKAGKITHDGYLDYEVDLGKAARKEITLSSDGNVVERSNERF
ncbi:MAG: hypothetical protein JWP08_1419 [Bryobacterales bacterium]|nr:hypothetical protein [Bryobacterales bacterium]